MNLNIINPFGSPYEVWQTRELTLLERLDMRQQKVWKPHLSIKVKIDKIIRSAMDAAEFLAADQQEHRLDRFVVKYLDSCNEYSSWLSHMPKPIPEALLEYQNSYRLSDLDIVNELVELHGLSIPNGQILFHGGVWPTDFSGKYSTELVIDRVLSTSFCPKVALNNGEWMGKAWDAGRLDLLLINLKSSTIKAFIFDKDLPGNGNELEVLFAKGAKLKLKSIKKINNRRVVNKYNCKSKKIHTHILSVDLS